MKKKFLIFSSVILFIIVIGTFQLKSYGYFEHSNVKLGSISGNMYSGGNAAEDEKYIYFSNYDEQGKLYRMDKNTKKLTKLCDDVACYINILDGYIYYSNLSDGEKIYKIKSDGSGRKKLGDSIAEYIRVRGSYIYYSNGEDDNCLYKMRVDGNKNRKIINSCVYGFNIINDKIYYLKKEGFYSVTVNGHFGKRLYRENKFKDEVILGNYIQIQGENIYFTNIGHEDKDKFLCKTDLKSFKFERLTDENVKEVNVHGEDIYYINEFDEDSLYTIKTDGSKRRKLKEGPISGISVVGDYIFYFKDVHGEIYRMNMDTEKKEKISQSNPSSMQVYNGKVVYTTDIKRDKRRGNLNRIEVNSKKEKMLSYVDGGWQKIVKVEDGWVYFIKVSVNKEKIEEKFYRVKINGDNLQEIPRKFDEFQDKIKGGYLYYVDSGNEKGCAIYTEKIGTGKSIKLIENSSEYLSGVGFENEKNIVINAVTDKWVYYSVVKEIRGSKIFSYLYRVNMDGRYNELISKDTITNLVEYEGYLYYGILSDSGALYRMNLDGSENIKILDGKIDNIYLVSIKDGWIYYKCGTDGNKLYRIKIDGSEKQRIFNNRHISFINIEGQYIYYEFASRDKKQFIIKNTEI
ncbi:DUF5050 domain-containing protein [Clostridium ganghwense]|uniref:DUF5050 domain-containing protein n=1 Tax=Clostridium ganghwense TaxID=312089 RepID=A0ABT4CWM4_9CLOT|nr:DUF5050 domain-containing protein [Clostridium ganghwense]MCY6372284.1 DUF5050 domain-containing protein [Clostridium ganghwense]